MSRILENKLAISGHTQKDRSYFHSVKNRQTKF
nr:MAG TPA: hypothetical protein [Caudoviricetes sp.]